jgi:hypothetical protein
MNTTRTMTRSPLAFTREALEVARAAMPAYSSKFSKKDFTRHQHLAILALKTFLKTTYRGIAEILHDWAELRDVLGLQKVPHFTTPQKLCTQLKKKTPTDCSVPPSLGPNSRHPTPISR